MQSREGHPRDNPRQALRAGSGRRKRRGRFYLRLALCRGERSARSQLADCSVAVTDFPEPFLSLGSLTSLHSEGLLFSSESTAPLGARLIFRPQSVLLTGNAVQVPMARASLPCVLPVPPGPSCSRLSGVHSCPIRCHPELKPGTSKLNCAPHARPLSSLPSTNVRARVHTHTHMHTHSTTGFLSWIRFLVTRIQKGKCNATHCFTNLRMCCAERSIRPRLFSETATFHAESASTVPERGGRRGGRTVFLFYLKRKELGWPCNMGILQNAGINQKY